MQTRAEELFGNMQQNIFKRTDHMFVGLMLAQWVLGIICALVVSPRTWTGALSQTHIHVWAAIFLGAAITLFPVYLGLTRPGWVYTRHTIAFAQMLWSALLIHLTGGRIETHFHVFGSLAFLAFYRDWPVLITATVVVAVDHFLRGLFWPQSVYGVLVASQWRWLEHAAWVIFCDSFLIKSCLDEIKEMRDIASNRARLERVNEEIQRKVEIATEKITHSNEELQQFAYIASHDLQEPLRMVANYLQLLEKRYQDKLDETATEYIGFAVDGAKRMKQLIQDLLEYSRVGTTFKARVALNADVVLKEAIKNLEIAIEETKANITYDAMPTVLADEVQLERLFQNLIGNAIKYRPKNATPDVHISARQGEGGWEFSVRDNGIGIEKKDHDRIFQIFQRLHTSSEYSGTGIGLSVCRKIAQNHGGKIWVDSEPGKGSNFKFTIAA